MKAQPLTLLLLLGLSQFSFADTHPLRLLSTSGYGEVQMSADQINVQMQAETLLKSASDAKAEVDQRVNNLLNRLAKMGIKEADIIASSLNITPNFEYQDRRQVFAGYRASRDINVTLKKLNQLDELLTTAIDSGINQIQQITPQNAKAEEYRQQAHELAIEDSKRKAASLAKAYDAELGPIHNISYQSSQPMPMAKQEMMVSSRLAADTAQGGRYLHDQITYTDSIQVSFELIIPR